MNNLGKPAELPQYKYETNFGPPSDLIILLTISYTSSFVLFRPLRMENI